MNRILFREDEWGVALDYRDPRAKHVREVLRAATGDRIAVGIVGGAKGSAPILAHSRGEGLRLGPMDVQARVPDPTYPLTLLLGHVRPIVMRRLLKDLTSLGVERIAVFPGELGEKSYLKSNLWSDARVEERLIDGASQAGVTGLPRVERYSSLRRALEGVAPEGAARDQAAGAPATAGAGRSFLLDPAGVPLAEAVLRRGGGEPAPERVCCAVGPERGFTPREVAQLEEAGFETVSLGDRILRSETAALLATGMVTRLLFP